MQVARALLLLALSAGAAGAQTARPAGERQSRADSAAIVKPMVRLESRLRSRIDTRLLNRLDASGAASANALAPLQRTLRSLDRDRLQPRR